MTENVQDLLSKAEEALWAGDQRTAGILLHQVLLQDFNDAYAWRLLHAMLGRGQPFETFQISFALKYYPQRAHLLHVPSQTTPGTAAGATGQVPEAQGIRTATAEGSRGTEEEVAVRAMEMPAAQPKQPLGSVVEAERPVPATQAKVDAVAEVEQGHTAPLAVERLPYMLLPDMTCPICGKTCPPRSKFCIYCGVPIEAAPARPTGTGSLLLFRPTSNLARDRAFSIWVDGKQVDQIMDGEQRLLSLSSGPHILAIKSAGRSTQVLQFTIRPSTQVRLVVQPARSSVRGAAPDLWLFPFHEEALQRQPLTRREQVWQIVRTLLIILLVSAFIGTITYIAFYMLWN
jgi:hypothetical protein